MSFDPKKNIVFGIHTYADWKKFNGRYKADVDIPRIQDAGFCVVVGEFADQHPEHVQGIWYCPWADIDYETIMR